jgi:type I restriction enzyme S subunit
MYAKSGFSIHIPHGGARMTATLQHAASQGDDLPQGYKRTEVGVIPVEWEVEKLGGCLLNAPQYGINAPAVPYSHDLPVYIRITDISENNKFVPTPVVSVSSDNAHLYFLKDGDLVFARTGASVGKSYLYNLNDGILVFAGFLIKITPKSDKLIANFLAAYVVTNRYWDWVKVMSMRSGQPGINGNEYAQLPIPLPPLPEQTAIATVLSNVDGLIASLTALIAKKRAVKHATMQQLLTGKTRLAGFTGEWEVKRLGDVCNQFKTGKLDANAMKIDGEYRFYTCARDYYFIDYYAFDAEALLVSGNGANVGYIHYYKGKFNAYQRTYVLTEFSANIQFLKLYMERNLQERIRVEVNAGNTPYITMDTLTEMQVFLPQTIEEQTAIAAILTDMDAEITTLETRLIKTKALKTGMCQALLTGKIRLV